MFRSVFLTFITLYICVNISECVSNFLVRFFIKPIDTKCTYLYDEQVSLDSLNVTGGEWKAASWNPTARTTRLINTPVNNSHSALFKQDK